MNPCIQSDVLGVSEGMPQDETDMSISGWSETDVCVCSLEQSRRISFIISIDDVNRH